MLEATGTGGQLKNRTAPLIALVLATTALLSACSGGPVLTAEAEDIATTAENALEQSVGSRPEIDCGTETIELKKGLVIDCVLTDPATGEQFESPVTIDKIEGTEYSISVQVADEPIK